MTEKCLIQFEGSDEIFFGHQGVLHYISNKRWIIENGFEWPSSVVKIPRAMRDVFLEGRPVCTNYSEEEFLNPKVSSTMEMRQIMGSRLKGHGIEFGAGASPFPVPLGAKVDYADMYDFNTLVANSYPGQSPNKIVKPSIICEFDELLASPNDSLDFIVACHVIEHTTNPIKAIVNAHSKLKAGGVLALVIPDKENTFDKARELTTLQHLALDYENYDPYNNLQHYIDFYTHAFVSQEPLVKAKEMMELRYPIHFHVWNYSTFHEMVSYITTELRLFSSIWSQPRVKSDPQSNEFYFLLTKGK